MSTFREPTPKQIDECATAYVNSCLDAIRTGKPHSIAYTKANHHFVAYPIGQDIKADQTGYPHMTREEALEVAAAFDLDPAASDFEERFRKRVFMDQVNRPPRETLASSFISTLL